MDKKSSLRINNRRETTFGITSILLAVASFLLFSLSVYQVAYGQQESPMMVGLMELVAILFSLTGLVFGLIGETRTDRFRKTAHLGILLNLLVGILHVIVLLNGY